MTLAKLMSREMGFNIMKNNEAAPVNQARFNTDATPLL